MPAAFVECVSWMRVFRAQADRARERGWPVHELDTGHEAMVTAPKALADVCSSSADAGAPAGADDGPGAETRPGDAAGAALASGRATELRRGISSGCGGSRPQRDRRVYEAADPAALHDALMSLPMVLG